MQSFMGVYVESYLLYRDFISKLSYVGTIFTHSLSQTGVRYQSLSALTRRSKKQYTQRNRMTYSDSKGFGGNPYGIM